MQSLAGGDAYVLAGDFNVVPGSAPYRLLTTANLPPNDPAYPPPPRDGGSAGWVPGLAEGLRSAYAGANGAEPEFTNFAQVPSPVPRPSSPPPSPAPVPRNGAPSPVALPRGVVVAVGGGKKRRENEQLGLLLRGPSAALSTG